MSQFCHLFLGRRTRTVWLLAILLLHVAAMWACVAIWVLCAHGAIRGAISSPFLTVAYAALVSLSRPTM